MTPSPTSSATATPTSSPSNSRSPSSTSSSSGTSSQSASVSSSQTSSPSESSTPSNTASASGTSSQSPSGTSTGTPTSSSTATETPTSTETSTPSVTSTETPTPSQSSSQTPTATATNTGTPTSTQTSTPTPTRTSTSSPTTTPTSSFTHLPLPRPCYDYSGTIELLPLAQAINEVLEEPPLVVAGEPWSADTNGFAFNGPMSAPDLTYSADAFIDGSKIDWLSVRFLPNDTSAEDEDGFGHVVGFALELRSTLSRQEGLELPSTLNATVVVSNDCGQEAEFFVILNIYVPPIRISKVPRFIVHEGTTEELKISITDLFEFPTERLASTAFLKNVSLTDGRELPLNQLRDPLLSATVAESARVSGKFDPRLPTLGGNVSDWIHLGPYENIIDGFRIKVSAPEDSAPLLSRIRLLFVDIAPDGPVYFFKEFDVGIVRDCVTTLASRITDCSQKCGGGIYLKSRDIITAPLGLAIGAEECLPLNVSLPCNTFSCDDVPRILLSLNVDLVLFEQYPNETLASIYYVISEIADVDPEDIELLNVTTNGQSRRMLSEANRSRMLTSSTVNFVLQVSFFARDFENELLGELQEKMNSASGRLRSSFDTGEFTDMIRGFLNDISLAIGGMDFEFVLEYINAVASGRRENHRPTGVPAVSHLGEGKCECIINLLGIDRDNDPLTFYIVEGPDNANLLQLSQIFSEFGYLPREGDQLNVSSRVETSDPVKVNDPNGRLLYNACKHNFNRERQMLKFLVFDGTDFSLPAKKWILPPSGTVLESNFLSGSESWSIVHNGEGNAASIAHAPYSDGKLFMYVFGRENLIKRALDFSGEKVPVVPATRVFSETIGSDGSQRREQSSSSTDSHENRFDDANIWYFQAPGKFSNLSLAYGGHLEFLLGAAEGDFSDIKKLHTSYPLVRILCDTCAVSGTVEYGYFANVSLASRLTKLVDDPLHLRIPLTSGEWYKRPFNPLSKWTQAQECQFLFALENLGSLQILGDLTDAHESTHLDSVRIATTKSRPIPGSCLEVESTVDVLAPSRTAPIPRAG
eukprot:gb/GECG01010054.1/.p1 GENE.gb/GECG01010054.1/~~gb/GECG01010054.1/.p1  ORF type:complete len:1040 (+),score=113.70 gb/GECG01010054.1/:1-3120(+)